jgi:hypothetical protein
VSLATSSPGIVLAASIVKNDAETGALFKAQSGGVACSPTAVR